MGQIYTRERYLARGGFSVRRFEAECLGEYASTFPIVCGDFNSRAAPAGPPPKGCGSAGREWLWAPGTCPALRS